MKTFPLRMNSVASVLRRVLGGANGTRLWSVVALVLFLLSSPSRARADIIDSYQFEPLTSTVLSAQPETISGSFTFDATTNVATSISITLSGLSPFGGTYLAASVSNFGSDFIGFGATNSAGDFLALTFQNELGVSPDPLVSDAIYVDNHVVTYDLAPVGGIELAPAAPAAAPEPSAVILLVTLVAMVGFLTRRKLAGGWEAKRTTHPTA
jgi:hypothetical protein